jgi:hypothetical protein
MTHRLSYNDTILLASLIRRHENSADDTYSLKKDDVTGAIDRFIDAGYIKDVSTLKKIVKKNDEPKDFYVGKIRDMSYKITPKGYEECLLGCSDFNWDVLQYAICALAVVIAFVNLSLKALIVGLIALVVYIINRVRYLHEPKVPVELRAGSFPR